MRIMSKYSVVSFFENLWDPIVASSPRTELLVTFCEWPCFLARLRAFE